MDDPEQMRAETRMMFAWRTAFVDAGFTVEEAMALLVAGQGRSQVVTTALPPEMLQLIERQTKFLEDEMMGE